MTDLWQARTELLLGKEPLEKLHQSHVLVVGLGGVGSYAAENICRSGVGKMTIVDGDRVNATNLNRQIPGLQSSIGKEKAEIMGHRLLDINPRLDLTLLPEFITDGQWDDFLSSSYDYVVDAIDTLSPKIYLLYHSVQKQIPVISSMGAGGKTDPEKVRIADISETRNCTLARVLRKKLHGLGIYKGIKAVYSEEKVAKHAVMHVHEEKNKKTTVGTISYMPSIFGCYCASVVIRDLMKK